MAVAMAISGCSHRTAISIEPTPVNTPEQWSQGDVVKVDEDAWLTQLIDQDIQQGLSHMLQHNFELKQQELSLQALQQSAIATGTTLWPKLDLTFSNNRRKSASNGSISTNHELSFSLSYELDLWGKLSAEDRRANLQVASQKAQLAQFKHELVRRFISAWFQAIEAHQQLQLSEQRYTTTMQSLAIIESGYESGLNSALDVYLTRNEVASEQARLANQRLALSQAKRELELLLGQYPEDERKFQTVQIPDLIGPISMGLPSEVVANKPELNAQWLSLLSQDAGLAYAHKQRFPSISLTSSLGNGSAELDQLLSGSWSWSLAGNITQPLFNAGRLKANEEKARLDTLRLEQAYLALVNQTFANVENALSKERSLNISVQANRDAAKNAVLAEDLSFEQYLGGLVSYTTVLDAKNRAFNAQSALIQSKYQLIDNRLQLYVALGGDFNSILSNGSNGL